jgi:hypothetical protein
MEYMFVHIASNLPLKQQADFLNDLARRGWRVHSSFLLKGNFFRPGLLLILLEKDDGKKQTIEGEHQRTIDRLHTRIQQLETRLEQIIAILPPSQKIFLDLDKEAFDWALTQITGVEQAEINRITGALKRARIDTLSKLSDALQEGRRIRHIGEKSQKPVQQIIENGNAFLQERAASAQDKE